MIKTSGPAAAGGIVPGPVPPKLRAGSILVGGLILLGGCSTPTRSDEPWVYALSRNFYPAMCADGELISAFAQDTRSGCAAVAVVVVFALPFAIDTVLLPITAPHDWMLAE